MTKMISCFLKNFFQIKNIVLLLGISGVIFFSCQSKIRLDVSSFQTEEGWGYQIMKGEKVFIYQPTIPGIPGNQPFVSEEEAMIVGRFVLEKIKNKQHPAISIQEIDSLNISCKKNLSQP